MECRNSVLKSNSKSQNIKLLLPLQENLVHEEKALGGSFNNHFTSTSQNIDCFQVLLAILTVRCSYATSVVS